ncbi:DHH family phosphoesterase [Rhodoferax antarcticus]|uniref:Phosphoesterase, DHHA1 n=1 Tax=Rhodoferax antarcticus ANT.BR TaxID=1111071 RepID=A0A1Q8Y9X7_9BURK|nr:DHHA1 domain-containing protein [Rhodoferax antarcticus]APW46966.1 phosphoesterase [Rhodoferax antarcticus]MCW2311695.1 hypothetical protein [Rhodoferax antarcticus]OLP04814.1 phosphoesterase, DHHA1 [Rhodoferax antarcticus ANT.BR]
MSLNLTAFPDIKDPQPLVIYHGRSCPDGFAAALAAWLYYDGQAEFLALDHGDVKTLADLPPVAGRAVYILDFSFAEPLLRDIDAVAAKLVVLDHHLSAAEKLTGFQCRSGVVHFDMKKSGAHLAWAFFHPDVAAPDLVKYVEDRDIWVWQYPESAGFLAALDMEPFDFARWQAIAQLQGVALQAFINRGRAMDEKFVKLAQGMSEAAQPLTFNGLRGLMVNVPSAFHSLVGDILCEKSGTFALMWAVDKTGVVKCGLRSRSGFNCIPLAESMHGGGHAQACGFKMQPERLPELLGGSFTA